MAGTSLGWQGMGSPDFSRAAQFFYRLPADLRESLNRSEEKVVIWAFFLTWWQSFHSGRGTALASFSETWLGAKFGRSRWTVLRALAKLEDLSLLTRIRRKPKKDGTFQTNLIALGARLHGVLGIVRSQVPDNSPCSKSAPQRIGNEDKQERTAPFPESASPSLSLSRLTRSRAMDEDTQKEEKRVEKGTLMRLYLELKGK